MKRDIKLIIIIIFLVLFIQSIYAYRDNTHKMITKYAVLNSILKKTDFLKSIGFEKGVEINKMDFNSYSYSILDIIKYGSIAEDEANYFLGIKKLPYKKRRYDNHFHNPIYPTYAYGVGLNDYVFNVFIVGDSAMEWAQNKGQNKQGDYPEGDNSWQKIREYYYKSLTKPSTIMPDGMCGKDYYFSLVSVGLGHQVHLLQDMSVPDHVRNDAHPDGYYEIWYEENIAITEMIINSKNISDFTPDINFNDLGYERDLVQYAKLFDSDLYDGSNPSTSFSQGLSEYANANYFSEDTIFSAWSDGLNVSVRHQFPYPNISSTNMIEKYNGTQIPKEVTDKMNRPISKYYISKIGDGEEIGHFLTSSYLQKGLTTQIYNNNNQLPLDEDFRNAFRKSFYRDEHCFLEYANRLIPRAVGYSTALIDYFFRGKLEISLPSTDLIPHPKDGIYSFTDERTNVFNDLTVCIKNNTKNNDGIVVEDMVGGTISLVIRYRLPEGGEGVDQFQSEEPPMPDENSLIYQVFHQDKIVEIDNEEKYLAIDEKQKIPSDKNMKVKFDISANPIPVNATDLSIQVIYKGSMGKFEEEETPEIVYEKDSVAVGYKDISEPTPIDIVNDSNRGYFGGNWYDLSEPCINPNSSSCTGEWKAAFDQANCSGDNRIDPSFEKSVYPVTLWLGLINFNGTLNTVSYNEGSEATDNYYINYNVEDSIDKKNRQPKTIGLDSWDTDTLTLPVPINSDFRYYILADIDKPVVVNYRHYVQLGVSYSYLLDTVALGDRSVKTFQNKLKWSDPNYVRSLSNLLTLYRGKYRHHYLPFFHLLEPSITASTTQMKKNELVDVVLAWDASHDCITEVKLDDESKALIGEVIKKPSETTTYTFTFTRNDNTTFEKNITVTVADTE